MTEYEHSGFFDAKYVNGELTPSYNGEDFARFFSAIVSDGVFKENTDSLKVTPVENSELAVYLCDGRAMIKGRWYENNTEKKTRSKLKFEIEAAEENSRYDLLVLRFDTVNGEISAQVKKGTESPDPQIPTLTRTENIHELQLAVIKVTRADLQIDESDISDTRANKDVCGFVYELIPKVEEENKNFKYSIVIDNSADNLDPEAIEYADDCRGFLPASGTELGDWGDTDLVKNYFKPCLIKPTDSEPHTYLNRDDYTLTEDGESANLLGGDNSDVMIEIKKLYGKFTTAGNKTKISIMNYREDENCFCFTEVDGIEKEKVYRGAYLANTFSTTGDNVLRSTSGSGAKTKINLQDAINECKARGTGYHLNNIYIAFLYQLMYLFMYKNKNSQKAFDDGPYSADGISANGFLTDAKGFFVLTSGATTPNKFLGCENFYSNGEEWLGGIIVSNKKNYLLTKYPSRYNTTGSGYEISEKLPFKISSANNYKIISQLCLTNNLCALPKGLMDKKATESDFTKYGNFAYCDALYFNTSSSSLGVRTGAGYMKDSDSGTPAGGVFAYEFTSPTDTLVLATARLCRA